MDIDRTIQEMEQAANILMVSLQIYLNIFERTLFRIPTTHPETI